MSQVTQPSSWALLLYACAERTSPFYPFSFSRLLLAAEMPPDAGHGKRESAPATISGCHVFPVLKPSCHGGRKAGLSPCPLRRPLNFPVARCAILYTSPFPSRLSSKYVDIPMPPFQTASVAIFVAGAKVKTGLGSANFLATISTLRRLR